MKAQEHRGLGDAATSAARVDLGGDTGGERLELSFGDVVALSGDFFVADGYPVLAPFGESSRAEMLASEGLFHLAAVAGERGERAATRDEVICALKVMAADQMLADARFEPGGEFGDFNFSRTVSETDVERRVRDRFLALGASNDDHFVAPGARGPATETDRPAARFGSAPWAYRQLHERALDEAWHVGRHGGDISRAMAREAAAQHYLTDAFAAGHLRTPVAAMREFWQERYPWFWEGLRRKVASETAAALRELAAPLRVVPTSVLYGRTFRAVTARTSGFPRISLGDLLAKVFHDWDNTHGLALEGGGRLFGDGCLDQGVTRELALAAVLAGVDDVEVALGLGASGKSLSGEGLYRAVREATGAPTDRFVAETTIPTVSPENPPQNWQAPDVEALWESPIVGSTGTTVGKAVAEALELGEELPRRLDCLGHAITDFVGLPAIPGLRQWVGRKACQAYRRGFMESLAADPKGAVLACIGP
ncbi:MAG: hypothetical protein M3P53_13310 [Actinomycetota bacterium]|nr:hypothetical protein [Actinomycetota bacterium]